MNARTTTTATRIQYVVRFPKQSRREPRSRHGLSQIALMTKPSSHMVIHITPLRVPGLVFIAAHNGILACRRRRSHQTKKFPRCMLLTTSSRRSTGANSGRTGDRRQSCFCTSSSPSRLVSSGPASTQACVRDPQSWRHFGLGGIRGYYRKQGLCRGESLG